MTSRNAGGYALVAVLWLLALLTAIVASYDASARVERGLFTLAYNRVRAESLAEAGIWLAAREHFASRLMLAEGAANAQRAFTLFDTDIAVTIVDSSGKINLNAAPAELIEAAFASAGIEPRRGVSLAAAVLDWRDADEAVAPGGGAEDADYARARLQHGAKDAPFATVDELRYVLGMTDDVFRRVAPLFTIHGHHARVNIDAAPEAVLRALPGADDRNVSALLGARGLPERTAVSLDDGIDRRFTQTGGSDIYFITGSAEVAGVRAVVTATVRFARGEAEPIQVIDWEADGA